MMINKYGFSVEIGDVNSATTEKSDRIISGKDYTCHNNMIDKFSEDKLFFENDDFIVVLDGYTLNKSKLMAVYNKLTWGELIVYLYKKDGDAFFNALRGSFSGALFDKKEDKWIIFTDQIGSKFLYYTYNNGVLFCSSMVDNVYNYLKEKNISYSLNVENAYLLLTYGFMLEKRTLCDKIKKLEPGCYLTLQKGELKSLQYYLLDNTANEEMTENEAIEIIDKYFREAVRLEFEKDKEYGYKHLVELSAGLDSRMTSWVAHDMGYTKQLNITFSQSNYYDETVPKQIASDLKHDWIFKSLDNGLWLYDVDEITRLTGGNVLYTGIAHGNSLCKYLNYNSVGGGHTGLLGGAILGTYNTSRKIEKFTFGDGAYSTQYIDRLIDIKLPKKYTNQELAKLYYRGFEGIMSGGPRTHHRTETFSPFLYLNLLEQVLKIPFRLRYNHYIYKKWILTKYPKAADYVWEKIGRKISRSTGIVKINGNDVAIEDIAKKSIRKIGKYLNLNLLNSFATKNHMNPIGYYINTNSELREFIDKYIDDNIDRITDLELKADILKIKNNKNAYMEKIQVLSLLSALKIYF